MAPKNDTKNRNDIAWKHSNSDDGDTRKLQFKYLEGNKNKSLSVEASHGWYSPGYWSMQGCL